MHRDSKEQGLSPKEAQKRLLEYGENSLPSAPPTSLVLILIKQFFSPFIYILLVAAIISFAVTQIASAIFIIAVLLINAIIGTIQEYSTQKSYCSTEFGFTSILKIITSIIIRFSYVCVL